MKRPIFCLICDKSERDCECEIPDLVWLQPLKWFCKECGFVPKRDCGHKAFTLRVMMDATDLGQPIGVCRNCKVIEPYCCCDDPFYEEPNDSHVDDYYFENA